MLTDIYGSLSCFLQEIISQYCKDKLILKSNYNKSGQDWTANSKRERETIYYIK